ncbi:hypothetical protein C4J98_4174 [Pseudomonas orientalis]|uniref:nucleotidyltransferase domain-containing protein n=1 Tax=Pseudomonas orientalis TaxID=76758 RepID=UPI000F566D56|nr:nucleotidyltransferase [Pseudomonas orientalis]AZE85559.1 hypothetical protein C4J98_4174 [Pseudomonas orientalis]
MLPMFEPKTRLLAKTIQVANEETQWESFIVKLLKKLELPEEKRRAAEARYYELARHVAHKLNMREENVHVVVQGSMRTQTTVAGYGPEKFDLDIVIKVHGGPLSVMPPDMFFNTFGEALRGIPGAGEPEAKNRCWRLRYPGESFYFDVTPAVPVSYAITGADLRVRDQEKGWSPSNPEEFASWFCSIAQLRFAFEQRRWLIKAEDAAVKVDPLPSEPVRIDDILRRLVQLMKLHRDSYFRKLPDERRMAMPISVILVTLATKAYQDMATQEPNAFVSAIDVVLEVVERMPGYIKRDRQFEVNNPALEGPYPENFADKWNHDGGLRAREFNTWHRQLSDDLFALFVAGYSKRSEEKIRAVFGEVGVSGWKEMQPQPTGILGGLLATAPGNSATQPQRPRSTGERDTLA